MQSSVTDLRAKDVVDVRTGCRIGTVYDVLIDTCSGYVLALLVFSGKGFWGFCGKGEEIRIAWADIEVIGDHVILVNRREFPGQCAPSCG